MWRQGKEIVDNVGKNVLSNNSELSHEVNCIANQFKSHESRNLSQHFATFLTCRGKIQSNLFRSAIEMSKIEWKQYRVFARQPTRDVALGLSSRQVVGKDPLKMHRSFNSLFRNARHAPRYPTICLLCVCRLVFCVSPLGATTVAPVRRLAQPPAAIYSRLKIILAVHTSIITTG